VFGPLLSVHSVFTDLCQRFGLSVGLWFGYPSAKAERHWQAFFILGCPKRTGLIFNGNIERWLSEVKLDF